MDLSKHLEKAAEAVKRRAYPLAIDIYGKLLAVQPDSGAARAGLHEALFKKAAAKKPSRVVALLGGGIHLLTGGLCRLLGRHAAAAKAYERYLALDPLHEGANLALGRALQRAGFKSSALAVFRAYAGAEPRCLEAARSAGALAYEAGLYDEALELYEQALRIDPRDQESLKARKNLAAEGALRKTGLEHAKHSRELLKDAQAQRQIERDARLQLSPEEISAELAGLEEQLAERPDDVRLLRRVADLRRMDGDLQAALDCLERAVQVEPGAADLAEKAGDLRLLLQEQRVQEARARGDAHAEKLAARALAEAKAGEFRRRVQRNPTDLGLRQQLGSALLELGQLDEAIAELQQAVKDPRAKVEALLKLGHAFRQKGLADLALGQFQKALDATGATGRLGKEILYEMGLLTQATGKREQALAHFSRIIEQDIGFRDVARRVAELESAS